MRRLVLDGDRVIVRLETCGVGFLMETYGASSVNGRVVVQFSADEARQIRAFLAADAPAKKKGRR